MNSQYFIACIAGLGGMLGWGFADFFAKKTIDAIGDISSLVWAHITGTVVFILLAVFNSAFQVFTITYPSGFTTWLFLIFFGVLQGIVYLLVYKGFGKGQLAVLNPIFASFTGIVALISILLFHEPVTYKIISSLGVIFLGVLIINLDVKAFSTTKISFLKINGFAEIISATILAAIWTILWDIFIHSRDWFSSALWMYVFMSIFLLAYAYAQKVSLRFDKKYLWKFLFFIGICEAVAYISISIGYSQTSNTSIVALLSGAFSLPTIFLARVYLKEKTTRIQTIGSFVIVFGIIILTLI